MTLILLVLWATVSFASFSASVPAVSFPVNSQVPSVARIDKPFSFVFSPSTFTSTSASPEELAYSLADAPAWLSIDSGSRRIYGTPKGKDIASGDVVGVQVELQAEDASGSSSLNTTLVVSRKPPPEVAIPLASQAPSFGYFSPPSSILTAPNTPFTLSFEGDTFSDPSGKGLSYYATTAPDSSPLPAWITFDATNLSFSGTTPAVGSTASQAFEFLFIASDVPGFSAVSIPFSIVVGNHTLETDKSQIVIDASETAPLKYTDLRSHVTLDGRRPSGNEVVVASTPGMPPWLSIDKDTWVLSGSPPVGVGPSTFTIILDGGQSSNALNITVSVNVSGGIFKGGPPKLAIYPGDHFEFDLSKYLSSPDEALMSVDIAPPTPWMRFDTTGRVLSGNPPSSVSQSDAPNVTIRVTSKKNPNRVSSETLSVRVGASNRQATSSSEGNSMSPSKTSSSADRTSAADASDGRPPLKVILMAVLFPVLSLVLVIAFVVAFCACRRRQLRRRASSPRDKNISDSLPERQPADDDKEKGQGLVTTHEVAGPSPEPEINARQSTYGAGAIRRFRALIGSYPPAQPPPPGGLSSASSSGHFPPEATRRPWLSAAARRLSGKPLDTSYLADAASFADSSERPRSLRQLSLNPTDSVDFNSSRHTLELTLPTPSLGTFQETSEHAHPDSSPPPRRTPSPERLSLAETEEGNTTSLEDFLMAGISSNGGSPSTSSPPSVCENRISVPPPSKPRRWTATGGVSRIMQSLRRKREGPDRIPRQSDTVVAGPPGGRGADPQQRDDGPAGGEGHETESASAAEEESGYDDESTFYIMEASVARGVEKSSRRPGKFSLKDIGQVSLGIPYEKCTAGPAPVFYPSQTQPVLQGGAETIKDETPAGRAELQQPDQQQPPEGGERRERSSVRPASKVPPRRRTQGSLSLSYFMTPPPPPLAQRGWLETGGGGGSSSTSGDIRAAWGRPASAGGLSGREKEGPRITETGNAGSEEQRSRKTVISNGSELEGSDYAVYI